MELVVEVIREAKVVVLVVEAVVAGVRIGVRGPLAPSFRLKNGEGESPSQDGRGRSLSLLIIFVVIVIAEKGGVRGKDSEYQAKEERPSPYPFPSV